MNGFRGFLVRPVSLRRLFDGIQEISDQHRNAAQDLIDTLKGNGVNQQFDGKKLLKAARGIRRELGVKNGKAG